VRIRLEMSDLRRSLGSTLTTTIARLVTRRARWVVGAWLVVVFVLAGQGQKLERDLVIHSPLPEGSASQRAQEISLRDFHGGYPLIVLLRGPRAAVEAQGRELASRLREVPRTVVVSPWEGGGVVAGLAPRPGAAALLVRTGGASADQVSGLLPPVERKIDATVKRPVRASLAGLPVVIDSLRGAIGSAASIGELLALPVLLLVLLFVFRSVLAAFVPLLVGGMVVAASKGVLDILQHVVELDFFVVGVTAMMGLALGVDYSLLVVSRFREERGRAELPEAMLATVSGAARSLVPAGGALVLGMAVGAMALPNLFIRSIAIGIGTAAALSVVSALLMVPALLVLFGRHLDRWSLPERRPGGSAVLVWSRRIAASTPAVLGLIFILFVLSGIALGLKSGIATAGLLPSGDSGRVQQEEVERTLGPGWGAPAEVVLNGRGTPLTSPRRLKAIARFQRQVEDDPGVASAAGLLPLEQASTQLAGFESGLVKQEQGLDRLESGLSRLGDGAAQSGAGLAQAAVGSQALHAGVGAANAGAGALAGGLQATSSGSNRMTEGLGRVGEGSGQLSAGASKASAGANRLRRGISRAAEATAEIKGNARVFDNAMRSGRNRLDRLHTPLQEAEAQLAGALSALRRMTSGKDDSEYAAALAAVEGASRKLSGRDPSSGEPVDSSYEGVEAGIEGAEGQFEVGEYLARRMRKGGEQASEGFEKLAGASAKLDRGLLRLASGSRHVSTGIAALTQGGERLSPALRRLSLGAHRLSGGLTLLEQGAGKLAGGLAEGAGRSQAIPKALHRMGGALAHGRESGSQLTQLRRRSPGMFRSAYFVLAALDGSAPGQRAKIGSLIDLDRGGMDARILVIPKGGVESEGARRTIDRIEGRAERLSRETGAEVLVGGVGPGNEDINDAFRGQAPLMRLVMALVGLLILTPLLRSLLVPIIAVIFNLLTVSATFGVLALLFNGSLLGGPGYVDVTAIPGTIMVIFGLAIDYEVFVFARIREEYIRTGSTEQAISGGIDRTGHVVTGAAVIMVVVFFAFSTSGLISLRNLAIAQVIAILIDAFIVRLVMVPAVMTWLGDRCWWLPRWLSWLRTPSERSPAQRQPG
jgi:RND superfamily putative drug exporter